jgi:exopolysaccharide biosynthesis polyprenyl glycosylphosphotransferase
MSMGMRMKEMLLRSPDHAGERRDGLASEPERRRASTATRQARLRLATDVVMLALAGTIETISASSADVSTSPGWRLAFAGLVLALLALRGRYRAVIGPRFLDDARTILSVTAISAMIVTFFRLLVSDHPTIAEEEIRSWGFAAVYLIAGRGVLAMVTERVNTIKQGGAPTLILGAGRVGHLIARRLLAHPELGLRPIGFVDPDPLEVERPSGIPVLGSGDDLERVVREHGVEHAIVAFSTAPHDMQLGISRALQQMKVSISIVPRLFEGVPDKIELERVGGLPLVSIYPSDPSDWRVGMKYASDRILALIATIIVSPLLLVCALGTLLTIGRPILFRQRRVGLDGNEFEMLKFRSMKGDPEDRGQANAAWAEAQAAGADVEPTADGGGGKRKKRNTSRFGALLRRSGVDELPQLFNVLRGEMSIVGPRPEQPAYVSMFEQRIRRYDDRHRVKAGITGWAQVHGLRGDTALDDRIEWDNYYIENWSPWLDLKIMMLTVLELLRSPPE